MDPGECAACGDDRRRYRAGVATRLLFSPHQINLLHASQREFGAIHEALPQNFPVRLKEEIERWQTVKGAKDGKVARRILSVPPNRRTPLYFAGPSATPHPLNEPEESTTTEYCSIVLTALLFFLKRLIARMPATLELLSSLVTAGTNAINLLAAIAIIASGLKALKYIIRVLILMREVYVHSDKIAMAVGLVAAAITVRYLKKSVYGGGMSYRSPPDKAWR